DRTPAHQMSLLVRRERLHALVDDDRLRQCFGRGPVAWERTVDKRIVGPRRRDQQSWRRRLDPQEMDAVAPVEHLQDVDLRRSESFRELGVCFRRGLEPVRRRPLQKCGAQGRNRDWHRDHLTRSTGLCSAAVYRYRTPCLITTSTRCSSEMYRSTSPRTAMMSAYLPGLTVPTFASTFMATEGQYVAARIAVIGSTPSVVTHASSSRHVECE